jgi:hypothetical protein
MTRVQRKGPLASVDVAAADGTGAGGGTVAQDITPALHANRTDRETKRLNNIPQAEPEFVAQGKRNSSRC